MIKYNSIIGPFAHNGSSSTRIMYLVILTLLPACVFAGFQFGRNSLALIVVCCLTSIMSECFCLLAMKKKPSACFDGSAILTGLLLAMSLPPSFPISLAVLGSMFAIILGKQIYGGLGQNLFNPAMLARVMLLICFPVQMTQWAAPTPIDLSNNLVTVPDGWLSFDGVTAATALSIERTLPVEFTQQFFGQHSGSLGETSAFLILCGGGYLIWRRIIHWAIPVTFMLGLTLPALVSHLINAEAYLAPWIHLTSGAAMLGAFYIATDLVTSPTSIRGQLIYGLGCGLLVWLIRTFGSYPEGVAFAVLIMNAVSPLIDYYLRPNVFGTSRVTEK